MTNILIDLGNTALKWATSSRPEEPYTFVHHGSDVLTEALQQSWLREQPEKMFGCMVSSENLAFNIAQFCNANDIKWEWLRSEKSFHGNFDLINQYDNYQQLGSDRWYAAIGAVSLYPQEALLVVQMGTATTVDAVIPCKSNTYQFKGGRILPGPTMMYDALLGKTRCRPNGVGYLNDFPTNTADAITTGILEAHLGLIRKACEQVEKLGFYPKIICSGGASPMLAPYIRQDFSNFVLRHNLVLCGLAQHAKVLEGTK